MGKHDLTYAHLSLLRPSLIGVYVTWAPEVWIVTTPIRNALVNDDLINLPRLQREVGNPERR